MYLKNIFLLFCFLFFINTNAQEGLTGLRVGLYGDNALNPGLKIGSSYLIKEKNKTYQPILKFGKSKGKGQIKKIQYLIDGNIGFYNHFYNHTGGFVGIGFTRMRTKIEKGTTLGYSFEINYLRKFYNFDTYELTDDGSIEQIGLAGSNNMMYAFAPSWGKTFGTKKGGNGVHLYIKPSLQMLEYNHSFFLNTALELGMTLNLKQ